MEVFQYINVVLAISLTFAFLFIGLIMFVFVCWIYMTICSPHANLSVDVRLHTSRRNSSRLIQSMLTLTAALTAPVL